MKNLNQYFVTPFVTDNESINDFILALQDLHGNSNKVFNFSPVSGNNS